MTKQEIQKRLAEIEADIPNYSYDSDEYRILSYQLEWFRQQLKKAIRLEKITIGQKVLEEEERR